MKLIIVYSIIFIYGLKELFESYSNNSIEGNILMMVNLLVILCLIVARFILHKAVKGSKIEVDMEIEDHHQLMLERKVYDALTSTQVAVSLSFTAVLVGFVLLRDTEPEIALWSWVLSIISFVNLFPSQQVAHITNPSFRFPDPHSKNYDQEFFDQIDDGEKYLMLKSLYKLHAYIVWGLVVLASSLMFYSSFTGNSQVISIIGIGILLLLIQTIYTISLKPSKLI